MKGSRAKGHVSYGGLRTAEAITNRSGLEPALSGPTFKRPILSTRANDPPPAPISIRSIPAPSAADPIPS